MDRSNNYLVNVQCPHCSAHLVAAVSGFGGELAVRSKVCSRCGKDYFLYLLAQTSAQESIHDGQISSLEASIAYLNKQRKQNLANMLIRHEAAQRLYRESLEMARQMRDRHSEN